VTGATAAPPKVGAVVFDAYGTLFDVAGAARIAASEPGGAALAAIWPRLAEEWRTKQLAYTWLRSLSRTHADFARVTADALDWAMAVQGLDEPALRDRLIALYDRLPAYAEVPATLAALRALGLPCAILSNGTPAMLDRAVAAAGLTGDFDAVLSVEAVGTYKPDPRVYALVRDRLGVAPAATLFVSSNGWDVAGAGTADFMTVWVNRTGQPQDRLDHAPTHVLPDLTELPALAKTLTHA
jgi:2-haloacid dehalogenase